MSIQIKLIVLITVLITALSSCQVTVGDNQTDTQSDTQTQIETQPDSTSLILYRQYSESDYTLEIDDSNYLTLYPQYQAVFSEKGEIFDSILEDESYTSQSDLGDDQEIYTDTYSCPISGTLTIRQTYQIVGNSSILQSEQISTEQCNYEDDFDIKTFDYLLDSERDLETDINLVYEEFTYIDQNNEVMTIKSATSYENDQSLFEAYISSENSGRYLVRIYNEFETDEEILFYGENESTATLIEQSIEKDSIEPCLYQNIDTYSLNGYITEGSPSNWVDDCVYGFDEIEDYNYLEQISFYSDLSVISQSLSIRLDSTPIRSVFTVDNDDSLLELTVIKDNQIFHQEIGNVISDPFISLDAGDYYFYFRNVNFDSSDDQLFYQIKTEDSFILDNIEGGSNGAAGYIDTTHFFGENSGEQKDALGNIRQSLNFAYKTNVFVRLTSDVHLSVYISNENEEILYDIDDVYKLSNSQYYLSVTLEPGDYYLDVGSDEADRSDSVLMKVNEELY